MIATAAARRRAALVLGVALGAGACSPPSTTQEEGKAAPRAVAPLPEATACEEPTPTQVWARFGGTRCDLELRDHDEGLALHDLDVDAPPPAVGEPPPPCQSQTCVYEGTSTAAGPLLLAVAQATDSEMPAAVWLGVRDGPRLIFVDLWEGAGETVMDDYTRVGPSHALAPHLCGDALALLVVERVPAAQGVPPPVDLSAREGGFDPAQPEAAAAAVARDSCVAVDLPVP